MGRHVAVVAAVLVVGALALAGRAVSEPDPQPTEVARRLLGATASLAAPWAEQLADGGRRDLGRRTVLVSTPDGTGVRAMTPGGDPLWGPVATGATCAPSGAGAVCLTAPKGGTATAIGSGRQRSASRWTRRTGSSTGGWWTATS